MMVIADYCFIAGSPMRLLAWGLILSACYDNGKRFAFIYKISE